MVAPGFAPPACDAYKERRGRAFSAAWHGAWLFPENPLFPIPCFRSRIHPVHSRGVVIKGIDGLKSAVRPFGLNQPLITVTQCDVKKRSSRGRPHFNNVAGICDGQRARLWNLVEKRSPHSLIEPRPTGRTGPIHRELRSLSAIGLEADHGQRCASLGAAPFDVERRARCWRSPTVCYRRFQVFQ